MKLSQPIAHLFLFLVALIYGANYTIAKEVLDNNYIQPGAFILMRLGFATTLFFIFGRTIGSKRIEKQDWGRIIISGLFGAAANMLLFFYGLKHTTPIHASLIMTTTPILVLVIALVLGREILSFRKLIGILLGMTGAVLIITNGQELSFSSSNVNGDFMIFLNAVSYGIYLIVVKDLLTKYHPLTIIKWVFLFGFIFVLPFGVPSFLKISWDTFTPSIWMATGYVLLFTTFFAYLLNVSALRVISASTVSFYIYLQPVLATLIAILLHRDSLEAKDVLFFIMIFIGVFLVSGRKKNVTI